jgi:DNA-directed RNA polymerase specialized sigma24 family protein
MEVTPRARDWTLTEAAFERLLAFLDPDRDRAGDAYERVRQKLMKFFQWRGCARAEECTDLTINRVARRIDEGATVHVTNPYLYFHGVALNVLKEYWREPGRDPLPIDALPASGQPSIAAVDPIDEAAGRQDAARRIECLAECLGALAADERRLLTDYHRESRGPRIDHRKQLAGTLGIPLNALRIRVFRIRVVVQACVTRCTGTREMNVRPVH